MAVSTVIKNLNDGTITLEDGTATTPVTLTAPFTVGDLSISGLAQTLKAVVAYESRGTLNSVRHTSRTYPSGSFSFQLAEYSDASVGSIVDFAAKTNAYSANESTLGGNAEVHAIKITLTVEGTNHGDGADHTVVLDDCAVTVDLSEGDPNTGTLSFTCYGSVTRT